MRWRLSCGSGRMLWCSVSVFCVGIPAPRSSTPDRETNLPPSRDAPSHGRLVRTWPSPVPSSIAHHAPANTNTTPAQREYEATQPNEESQCGFGRLRESATNSLMLSMIEMTIIVSPIRCSARDSYCGAAGSLRKALGFLYRRYLTPRCDHLCL